MSARVVAALALVAPVLVALVLITPVLITLASPALAHHSYAMFDRGRTDTITGTVKSFEMINPHGWLNLVDRDPQGKMREWAFETGAPGQMERAGWSAGSVAVGDKISVTMHPMKDGSNSGQLVSAVLANGKTLRGFPGF
jgi:hypothetical protein